MPDITMCKGQSCPMKQDCYRYTAEPNPYRQSYFVEIPLVRDVSVSSQRIFEYCDHFSSNKGE